MPISPVWLAQFAVADGLHDSIGCNNVQIRTVPNQQAGIAEFVDHTWSPIGGIEDRLNGIVFKYSLCASGPFEFFLNIYPSFLF